MSCWLCDVLDLWDSRFVRFLQTGASIFALSLLWRGISRKSSGSLCRSRSMSGPAADWAVRDYSNISRGCCFFLKQSCQVLMLPSVFLTLLLRNVFQLQCMKTQFFAWIMYLFVSHPYFCWHFRYQMFSLTFKSLISFLRKIAITVPSVFEKIACVLHVRDCRTCIGTL